MKKILYTCFLILLLINITVICFAQDNDNINTIIGLENLGIGGYGGPYFRFTMLNGSPAVLGGGPLALIINQSIVVGFAGFYPEFADDNASLSYGGFYGGYIFFPHSRLSLITAGLIGSGGVETPSSGSGVFVIEPEVVLSIGIMENFRINLGGSLRLVMGADPSLGLDYLMKEQKSTRNLFKRGFGNYKITWFNYALFWIPHLLWNIIFTQYLPMDHFNGDAPNWLLISENIFRIATIIYPLLIPINTKHKLFKSGLWVYSIGLLLYYGCWTYLMIAPDSALAYNPVMQFAPTYTPLIWLIGMSLMSESIILPVLSFIFIGLHIGEYIFRYQYTF